MGPFAFPSAECRWFFSGSPSPDLHDWFMQSYTEAGLGQRTDYYLLGLPGMVNVKLREGRVEVKQRLSSRPGVTYARGQVGHLERWTKWSFPMESGAEVISTLARHADTWLPVSKKRYLRTFILEGEEVTETAPGSHPEKGCQAELTRLQVRSEEWYTLGLEAFGQRADLSGLLRSVAAFFLDRDFPVWLRQKDTMGYAEWLKTNYSP